MRARINALAVMSYQSDFRWVHGTSMPIPPFDRQSRSEQARYLRRAHTTAWVMHAFINTNLFAA